MNKKSEIENALRVRLKKRKKQKNNARLI